MIIVKILKKCFYRLKTVKYTMGKLYENIIYRVFFLMMLKNLSEDRGPLDKQLLAISNALVLSRKFLRSRF